MKKTYILLYPYFIILMGCSLIVIFFLFYFKFTNPTDPITIIEEDIAQNIADSETKSLDVEILGAINQPGHYQLSPGSIIQDVIDQAGGLTNEADLTGNNINPGSLISNDQSIFVPKIGSSENNNTETIDKNNSPPSPTVQDDSDKININNAPADELELLNGVGEKTAQKIIDYRQSNQFDAIEEIMEVSGIGPKMFEKIKDQICI
ncbi:MAG: helix-hairpin-helix domain-containing protein [Patescibacteria group bacterium]